MATAKSACQLLPTLTETVKLMHKTVVLGMKHIANKRIQAMLTVMVKLMLLIVKSSSQTMVIVQTLLLLLKM